MVSFLLLLNDTFRCHPKEHRVYNRTHYICCGVHSSEKERPVIVRLDSYMQFVILMKNEKSSSWLENK